MGFAALMGGRRSARRRAFVAVFGRGFWARGFGDCWLRAGLLFGRDCLGLEGVSGDPPQDEVDDVEDERKPRVIQPVRLSRGLLDQAVAQCLDAGRAAFRVVGRH